MTNYKKRTMEKCKTCPHKGIEGHIGVNPNCQYCTIINFDIEKQFEIDTKKCEFYHNQNGGLCSIYKQGDCVCSHNANCYYKQLQAVKKDQWFEDLYEIEKSRSKQFEEMLQAKDKEIEELKKELEFRKSYKQIKSDFFWDSVFGDDYPFNKKNAYKELHDYKILLDNVPKVYCEVTGNKLSYTTYSAKTILNAYSEHIDELVEKETEDLEAQNKTMRGALEKIGSAVENGCIKDENRCRDCNKGTAWYACGNQCVRCCEDIASQALKECEK